MQTPLPDLNSSSKFVRGTVSRVVRETAQCCSFELDLEASARGAFACPAGQFITLRASIEDSAHERCYSLSSVATLGEAPRFTVKRLPGGKVSNWCNDALLPGSEILVSPPLGAFTVQPGDGPLLLAAAGSGITPIYAMLREALAHGGRRITLLYANKSREHAIFAKEIEALRALHPHRVRLVEIFSDGTTPRLDSILPDLLALEKGADLYLCGPERFMAAIEAQARDAGFDETRIFSERFVPPASALSSSTASEEATVAAEVTALLGGVRSSFPCAPSQTLLEAGIAAGLGFPSSCRQGHCGACMTVLVGGSVTSGTTSALSRRDRQKGYILACQARPMSPEIYISYDT